MSQLTGKPLTGYHQRYLLVDLASSSTQILPLPTSLLQRYVGGTGLGVALALLHRAPLLDPLADSESPIVLAFSPFIGTPLTTSARFAIVSKSPLTQRVNDSLCGSQFAIEAKHAGFDAVVVIGRCVEPSVLVIDAFKERSDLPSEQDAAAPVANVSVEPAAELWGCEIRIAEEKLGERFGSEFSSLLIGPAGEQRVKFATVAHDGRHSGRGGTGALFGVKNLKAIVVRGSKQHRFRPSAELSQEAKKWAARSRGPETSKYRELGTVANLPFLNRINALPTRNFRAGSFQGSQQLTLESDSQQQPNVRSGCVACTIGCEHAFTLETPPTGKSNESDTRASHKRVRLEYESLFALGSLCGISEKQVILQAAERCDQLGMDTISLGGTLAFLMDCQERGLLKERMSVTPQFGDGSAMLQLIELTAQRKGIGSLIAEGSRLAAEQIGAGSIRFAPQIKGLELPGYDPRAMQTLALGLAVGSRGADHNKSGGYEIDLSPGHDRRRLSSEAVSAAIQKEDAAAVMDSLVVCKFLRGIFDDIFKETVEPLNLITGWQWTGEQLREVGQRIINAKKYFNELAGWQPAEDQLPETIMESALEDDAEAQLDRQAFQQAVSKYYQLRGWTTGGRLTKEQICELGLSSQADSCR